MQDAKIAVKKNKFFGKFVLMVFVTSCVVILFSSIITKVRQERFRMLESKTMLENKPHSSRQRIPYLIENILP